MIKSHFNTAADLVRLLKELLHLLNLSTGMGEKKSLVYFWIIALSSKALSEYSEMKPLSGVLKSLF